MILRRLLTRAVLTAAGGLLVAMAAGQAACAQEFLPNPALSRARSATSANGGIESEWEYHKPANALMFRTTITPISKFAGGSGYCTPSCVAPYYGGCATGCGSQRASRSFARACGCR
jgi:hypothetical protein